MAITGQILTERRAEQKRRELHYSELATELIAWIRERSNLMSDALTYSGQDSDAFSRDAYVRYPLSDFALRAQTSFPALSPHIEAYTNYGLWLMERAHEIAAEEEPFSRWDAKQRHSFVERGAIIERPLLAALAEIRFQLSTAYPKRLSLERVVGKAENEVDMIAKHDKAKCPASS